MGTLPKHMQKMVDAAGQNALAGVTPPADSSESSDTPVIPTKGITSGVLPTVGKYVGAGHRVDQATGLFVPRANNESGSTILGEPTPPLNPPLPVPDWVAPKETIDIPLPPEGESVTVDLPDGEQAEAFTFQGAAAQFVADLIQEGNEQAAKIDAQAARILELEETKTGKPERIRLIFRDARGDHEVPVPKRQGGETQLVVTEGPFWDHHAIYDLAESDVEVYWQRSGASAPARSRCGVNGEFCADVPTDLGHCTKCWHMSGEAIRLAVEAAQDAEE